MARSKKKTLSLEEFRDYNTYEIVYLKDGEYEVRRVGGDSDAVYSGPYNDVHAEWCRLMNCQQDVVETVDELSDKLHEAAAAFRTHDIEAHKAFVASPDIDSVVAVDVGTTSEEMVHLDMTRSGRYPWDQIREGSVYVINSEDSNFLGKFDGGEVLEQ